MTLHVICERDVGLFSLIQQVVAHIPWAKRAGRTPIVLFGDRCCYWVPDGYRERSTVWEYYFEPVIAGRPASTFEHRAALADRFPAQDDVGFWLNDATWVSSHFGDHPELAGETLSIPYRWRDPGTDLRHEAARVIREHVRPRRYLLDEVDAFCSAHLAGHDVIGVQIRGTDAVSSREIRAHRQGSLVLDHYRNEVGRLLEQNPAARLFVATDDERSLEFMRTAFGERVLAYDSLRHADGQAAGRGPTGCLMPAYVARDRQLAARNGEEAIIEYLLLAKCAVLVHNGSSLARTVLLTEPELPHVNTHRKNKLVAHVQSFSLKKLRRATKRALRLANPVRRRRRSDV